MMRELVHLYLRVLGMIPYRKSELDILFSE